MSTLFWWLAAGGSTLLVAATVVLVRINWSEQVYMQLLSATAVGTVTFLITFVSALKPSTQSTTFATSIVEDTRDHLPVFTIPDQDMSPASVRASKLSSVSRAIFAVAPEAAKSPSPPRIQESEVTDFYLDLLQYYILREVRDRQRVKWGVAQVAGPHGLASRPMVNVAARLSDPTELKAAAAQSVITGNRFAASQMERSTWEHVGLLVPRGAAVTLTRDPGGEGRGPASRSLAIRRPGYLDLVITVSPIGSSGVGSLPPGLSIPANLVPHCRTHHFLVTIKAGFPRLTAGSWRTDENKAWVQWLFNMLESRLKDGA